MIVYIVSGALVGITIYITASIVALVANTVAMFLPDKE